MGIKYLVVLFFVSITFFSCQKNTNPDYEKLIVGNWQLYNFSTNQKVANPEEYKKISRQIIYTTSLIIKPDGKIKSIIWGTVDNGYWDIHKDELIVYDKKHKTKFSAKILKLNQQQLLLYQKIGKVKVILYFHRFD